MKKNKFFNVIFFLAISLSSSIFCMNPKDNSGNQSLDKFLNSFYQTDENFLEKAKRAQKRKPELFENKQTKNKQKKPPKFELNYKAGPYGYEKLCSLSNKCEIGTSNLSKKSLGELREIKKSIEQQCLKTMLSLLYNKICETLKNKEKVSTNLSQLESQLINGTANLSIMNGDELTKILKKISDYKLDKKLSLLQCNICQALAEKQWKKHKKHAKKSNSVKIKLGDNPKNEISEDRIVEIVTTLLNNPKKIIEENRKISEFIVEAINSNLSTKELIERITEEIKQQKYSEICLLNECFCTEHMDREKTNCRTDFENKFSDYIIENSPNDTIICAFFGPGNLFAELRVATKILSGDKPISAIHLIDKRYGKIEEKNEIISDVINLLKNNKKLSIEKVERIRDFVAIAQLIQFTRLLNAMSETKIDVYLHESVQDYLDCIGNPNNQHLKANVGTIIDLGDKKNKNYATNLQDTLKMITEGMCENGLWGALDPTGKIIMNTAEKAKLLSK